MKNLIASSLLIAFSAAQGADLSTTFSCQQSLSPEKLVKNLIAKGLIDAKPYAGGDSISYFAARPGNTVFGLPLVAIWAWELGSTFFQRGPGTAPNSELSFLVRAQQSELESAVKKSGISVVRNRGVQVPTVEVSALNATAFDLPKGADLRFAYSQITCTLP